MKNIDVTVNDSTKSYPYGTTYYEISRDFENKQNKLIAGDNITIENKLKLIIR